MSQSQAADAISWMSAESVNFEGASGHRRSDRELADTVMAAAKRLQETMDAAIMAGLVVEPDVKRVENRFASIGVSSESYLVNVAIRRKLS